MLRLITALGLVATLAGPLASVSAQSLVIDGNTQIDNQICALVLKEIYRRLGLELTTAIVPQARATSDALTGKVDGEVGRTAVYGNDKPALIRVEPAFYTLQISAFFARQPKTPQSASDLAPYSVGVVRGFLAAESFADTAARKTEVDDTKQLVQMLGSNRFEVAVDGFQSFTYYMQKLRLTDLAHINLAEVPIYHYVNVKHRALVPKISAVIRSMAASGELAKVFRKSAEQLAGSEAVP